MSPLPSAAADDPPSWHTLAGDAVAARLGVDPAGGLDADEARRRRAADGPNTLPPAGRRRPLAMLAGQFADKMIVVLLAAAVVAGLVGDAADSLVIVVIVVLNAAIGFAQEYRAERAMAALLALAAPAVAVRRQGRVTILAADELCRGDVVLLEAGQIVAADLRLIETAALRVGEAALTGESEAVDKTVEPLADPSLPLADRPNMAWNGTQVVHGRGTGLVVAIGAATELGRIAALLATTPEPRTPLQQRLARFGDRLAVAVLAICAIVFVAGLLRGEPWLLMLMTAISLAVAAVPEALPAVVAIALALGAGRMARHQALIRRLPAVETLGSVTAICSDKTGTLTQNRMTVDTLVAAGPLPPLLTAMVLCNDARLADDGSLAGDPTETALLAAARDRGADPATLAAAHPRLAELPFDAARRTMVTVHGEGKSAFAYIKGAPESVLPNCAGQADGRALADAERLAAAGQRVLAFARCRLTAPPGDTDALANRLTDLEFLGLAGLIDPPRPEAAAAVRECREAGIVPIMITGDHPATARSIAARLDIAAADGRVMAGGELAGLDDAGLAAALAEVRVFARVDPEQKIRIVAALQGRGECVAMTGDGINDAPALKRADIGVAMGRGGTDVAREAAHMVLLDDNFATLVRAVREGRRIYDNIRRFVRYAMSCNSGEIWTIFLAPLLGLPLPLLPIHILWINLVTDGLPGLALAAERSERNVMRRPPRPPGENLFAGGLWQHVVWVGLLMGAVSLGIQAWALHVASPHWQSMVFTVLTLAQLGHALAIRSETQSLFSIGLMSNRPLALALLLTFVLQMATLYWPPANALLHTQALSAAELALCLIAASLVFWGVEAEKWAMRRGRLYRQRPALSRR